MCNTCFDVSQLRAHLEVGLKRMSELRREIASDTSTAITNQEMKRTAPSDSAGECMHALDSLPGVTELDENVLKFEYRHDVLLGKIMERTMGEDPDSNMMNDFTNTTRFIPKEMLKDVFLGSNIGPFINRKDLVVSGKNLIAHTGAAAYCRSVLPQVFEYLDESYLFYAHKSASLVPEGVGYSHGGIGILPEKEHAITEAIFPAYRSMIRESECIMLKDALKDDSDYVDENTFHQLGFGGFTTNRFLPHKACTSKADALSQMHNDLRTVVNGHTPQPTGLPMIMHEDGEDGYHGHYAITCDTQYTKPRGDNTVAIALFKNGSFKGKGNWLGKGEDGIQYEFSSNDYHIGTRVRIPFHSNATSDPTSTPYFRVVAKVTSSPNDNELKGMYICVNFPNKYEGNIYRGVPKVAFVESLRIPENHVHGLVLHNVKSDKIINQLIINAKLELVLPESSEPHDVIVEYVEDHRYSVAYAATFNYKTQSAMLMNLHSLVCGDIEGNFPYLSGFVDHACDLLGIGFTEKEEANDFGINPVDMDKYDSKGDFARSGFDAKALDPIHERVFYKTERIVNLMRSEDRFTCTLVCIGDCIGSPRTGQGETMLDNFLCVLWANAFCGIKIAGNRELNKLRLLSELPYAMLNRSTDWGYYELAHSFALSKTPNFTEAEKEERELKDKSILTALCFPAVLDANGSWVSKHPGLGKTPPPMDASSSDTESTFSFPGRSLPPIWTPAKQKHEKEEEAKRQRCLLVISHAKKAKVEEDVKDKTEDKTDDEVPVQAV